MKLLDEKGKVFGKINLIDLLVIVVIVAALVVVGIKVFGGNKTDDTPPTDTSENIGEAASTPTPPTKAKLTYTVRVTAQRKEIAEQLEEYVNIAEGKKDQLQHGGVLIKDAYVVDFWTEPCRYNVLASGEMEMIAAAEAEAAELVDICLVVESIVADTKTNVVGSLEVRIGKSHVLKTTHLEFTNGIVTACEWEPMEE